MLFVMLWLCCLLYMLYFIIEICWTQPWGKNFLLQPCINDGSAFDLKISLTCPTERCSHKTCSITLQWLPPGGTGGCVCRRDLNSDLGVRQRLQGWMNVMYSGHGFVAIAALWRTVIEDQYSIPTRYTVGSGYTYCVVYPQSYPQYCGCQNTR